MADKEHEESGSFCGHCGGIVGPDGLAALGEQEEFTPFEGEETEQQASTVKMRDDSGADFANAVRKSRGAR